MNIALPAVLLFLLVAPGFVYHHFSALREARQADVTPFGTTALKSIFIAVVLNAVIGLVGGFGLGYQLYLGDAVRLLSGTAVANSVPEARYNWLNEHPLPVLSFFLATHALALAAATLRRLAVQRYELDRPGSRFHRYFWRQAPWHYVFSGIDCGKEIGVGAVFVSAYVSVNGAASLYTGVLHDYGVRDDGQLDRIILSAVRRRPLDQNHVPRCATAPKAGLLESTVAAAAASESLLSR